jgi:hypothetical protein
MQRIILSGCVGGSIGPDGPFSFVALAASSELLLGSNSTFSISFGLECGFSEDDSGMAANEEWEWD